VKLLIDESLQQDLARIFTEAGHDAVHVADLGLGGATDNEVLARAGVDARIVVTADTDFGTLLALTGAPGPSVILLRRSGRRATDRARTVLAVLALVDEQLGHGAIVTVEQTRLRVRELPIER
jgi:predicted nuclease of predicted toxin-antitoxin system